MGYAEVDDIARFVPDSVKARLEEIIASNTFNEQADTLQDLVSAEIDFWDTGGWSDSLKTLVCITLTIERLYQIDALANPVPKDITAQADRVRDLLKMQTDTSTVPFTPWTASAYDPSIDETEPELDRLLEGWIPGEAS